MICKTIFLSMILIMFHRVDYKNEPRLKPLTKGLSNYDKLQKDLNTPVKDYNQIKDLVELENNSIAKLNNNTNNIKSKKNLEMMAHKKGKTEK